MRLQKYMAEAGIASRRRCEDIIRAGRVCVNGEIAEIGCVIDPESDSVTLDGAEISRVQERVVLLFYKPRGVVSTNSDPEGRKSLDYYFGDFPARLYHAGRLDVNSEGLLVMTNDGAIAKALTHPSHTVEKTYSVVCAGMLTLREINMLRAGVLLSDGLTAPARVEHVFAAGEGKCRLQISIHEGRNRQVRRMLEAVGHATLRLKRERIGELSLDGLAPGQWRPATALEMQYMEKLISSDKN